MRKDQEKILQAITKEVESRTYKIELKDTKLEDLGDGYVIEMSVKRTKDSVTKIVGIVRFYPEVGGGWRANFSYPKQQDFNDLKYWSEEDLERVLQYISEQLPKKSEGD